MRIKFDPDAPNAGFFAATFFVVAFIAVWLVLR